MRADMAKVIVERPRMTARAWPRPKGYQPPAPPLRRGRPALPRGDRGTLAGRRQGLNEHLGPLRRFLDKQVGRPWDKVFSEICARIDRSSAVQDHVRDHVEDYVHRQVILVDGVPCDGEGGCCYGRPLREMRWIRWYVCPRTGLLRRNAVAPRRRPTPVQGGEPPKLIQVGKGLQCRFLDGAWHLVAFERLPKPLANRLCCRDTDVLLGLPVSRLTPVEARLRYGAEVYAATKRRLARRELSQYPIPVRWWV